MKYNKPIIIACKEAPERLPPVLSIIKIAAKFFPEVIVLTNKTSEKTKQDLATDNIIVIEANPTQASIKHSSSILKKLKEWMKFKKEFWKLTNKKPKNTLLWIATVDSAFAIGKELQKKDYILGVLELYDKQSIYLKLMKSYMKNAKHIVTPDSARSSIFRVWYQLSYTPTVLPNKPYALECFRKMPVTNSQAQEKLDSLNGRKLILYQARMVRMETFDIAQAIKEDLGSEYVLGIMGEIRDKEMFQKLKEFYPELIHFDYLRPPEHLAVTSHAYIGLLIYNYESLNNIFCAPNKVWEYGAVSLPMLCHELPMLSQQLKCFSAGETFKSGDAKSITNAIKKIDNEYEKYVAGANELYNSENLERIFCNVINKAFSIKLKVE